jgi:hypothetical protein
MLFWTIKIILISAIIIFLINNILCLLSDTLTIPKVKNLVQITNKNYENIYNILSNNNSLNNNSLNNNSSNNNSSNNNSSNNLLNYPSDNISNYPSDNISNYPSDNISNYPLNDIIINSTPINLLPTLDNEESIKSELKNYLKEQLNMT